MLKCSFSQLITSGGGGVGKDSVLFKELVTGSLTVLQWVFEQYKLDLVVSFLFVGVGLRDGRVDLIKMHCVKFPNS